ncbi:hypothetical protein [Nocardioides caldifontis]|uniref:hypothetical protein n=1 Tax=Nocardioides caldifontis TaxID=2588938 RepID=UPI0011DF15A9|nr:hypothetical protein [Nocardioides caldifontis]
MFARIALTTASAAAVIAAFPAAAGAAPRTEVVDRSLFDATPELTTSSLRVDGPTSGPLGGAMDVTLRAADGTLPTTFGACEPARVEAVVTVQPGKVITAKARGEVCAHVVDGSLSMFAGFKQKDVRYQGYGRCKPRLQGEGFISVGQSMLGGQASFFGSFRR